MHVHFLRKKSYAAKINHANISYTKKSYAKISRSTVCLEMRYYRVNISEYYVLYSLVTQLYTDCSRPQSYAGLT